MAKVNLDKIQASKVGTIESVVHTADLENGAPIALGAKVAGERELVEVAAPTPDAEVLLVASPEVNNRLTHGWDGIDYVNKAGQPARAYHLTEGDLFQVEKKLVDGDVAEGDILEATADFLYAKVETPSAKTQFRVEQLTKLGFDSRDAVLLRVIKA